MAGERHVHTCAAPGLRGRARGPEVGDRDGEVPAPQSFEWWHALKTLGVPNQFVVYQNEGHAISQPEHMKDYQVRTLTWFDKYLAK